MEHNTTQHAEEKTKRNSKKLFVLLLIAIMIATTVTSYVFWSSGVRGANEMHDLTVTIGIGNELVTQIDLTAPGGTAAGNLIPGDITPNPALGETHQLTYTINAIWAEGANETFGDLNGVAGTLTVTPVALTTGSGTELLTATGRGDNPLFTVSFDQTSYTVIGNDTNGTDVEISVTMIQPFDRAQYNLIAGENLSLTLRFEVEPNVA